MGAPVACLSTGRCSTMRPMPYCAYIIYSMSSHGDAHLHPHLSKVVRGVGAALQLIAQSVHVNERPHIGDFPINNSVHREVIDLHAVARGGNPGEFTSLRSFQSHPRGEAIIPFDNVLNDDGKITDVWSLIDMHALRDQLQG